MQIRKNLKTLGVVGTLGLIGNEAMAAGPDFSSLSAAADFSTATTAVLAVAAAVIFVLVAVKGYKLITRAL